MTDHGQDSASSGLRSLELGGGRNFRDLGGYPATDGKVVRFGLLFRSGSPVDFTASDWRLLRSAGLRAICDLRTTKERQREPFACAGDEGLNYWAGDFEASFADLRSAMLAGYPTADEARAGMLAGYGDLPFELAGAYRQLFDQIKRRELPLIFNCTAGKDRTGVAAAIVLEALGVPREIVIEDYLLTNAILQRQAPRISRPQGRLSRQAPGVVEAIGKADPDYLGAALEAIEQRHGSIEGYLRDVLDVSLGELKEIRARLLA